MNRLADPPGFKTALALFQSASQRVPAYRQFLKQHSIQAEHIKTYSDWLTVPVTDKQNYIDRYKLSDLCWDGKLTGIRHLPMSSGSTGEPHFWPTDDRQEQASADYLRNVLTAAGVLPDQPALFVISFGLGAWKAGLEFYSAARSLGKEWALTVIAPGLDTAEVVQQVGRLQPEFTQIVVVGYPPFLKDIISAASDVGLDWSGKQLYMIGAGEAVVEPWRDKLGQLAGPALCQMLNVYGMAEVGMLGYETPETISLHRKSVRGQAVAQYRYSPDVRFFETDSEGVLLLTSYAGAPLIKYHTRDRGELVTAGDNYLVCLSGRRDVAASLYAVNIYPENIKEALHGKELSSRVSGIFTMETKQTPQMDQYMEITVELLPRVRATAGLNQTARSAIVESLRSLNSEYRKLSDMKGSSVWPVVKLVSSGTINYTPGRKHAWVRQG